MYLVHAFYFYLRGDFMKVSSENWIKKNDGNWYCYVDGNPIKGEWVQDECDRWYYLDSKDGRLCTGWFQTRFNNHWFYAYKESNSSLGIYTGMIVQDKTIEIDGKSYSFDKDGHWIEKTSLVSDECINFIKSWEGFYPNKYYDEVGILTQGYGLTGDEIKDLPDMITEKQASDMLKDLVNNKYAKVIKQDLDSKGIQLKQNEFDSLVSFSYNCGTQGLLSSTLYKNVCNGVRDYDTILSNFTAWSNGGGHRIEGLYRRRVKEAALFLKGDYTGNK